MALRLTWGDEQAALTFIHQIARKETALTKVAGMGMIELIDWIAEKYATRTGKPNPQKELEQFAMQTKGLAFFSLPDAPVVVHAGLLRGRQRYRRASCRRLAHQSGFAGRVSDLAGPGPRL